MTAPDPEVRKRRFEKYAQVRAELAAGGSARDVAVRMGLSRNAVIGLARRAKIDLNGVLHSGRPAKIPKAPKVIDAPRIDGPRVKREIVPYAPSPLAPTTGVSIHALTDDGCTFPIGDPFEDGFAYCGQPRSGRGPYCARCHALTHRAESSQRKRVA